MDDDVRAPPAHASNVGGEAAVRDDVDLVDLVDLPDVREDPVEDRPAADRQQRLRDVVGERTEPGRVAGREDDRLHSRHRSGERHARTARGARRAR